jgi:ATP-dependent Clp protease ATP-binding subunit ClpB
LGNEQIRGIAKIQLQQLHERLMDQELGLEISDAVMDKLCAAGFDPVYGARPLKRAIQRELENPLASALLRGEFQAGDKIVAKFISDAIEFHAS